MKLYVLYQIFKSFASWLALLLPTILLIAYIIAPTFRGMAAIFAFYQLEHPHIIEAPNHQAVRREVQQFFLHYNIIIDADDIMDVEALKKEQHLKFKPKGCLEHRLIAYVPLNIRLPLYGTQTYEWCLIIKA